MSTYIKQAIQLCVFILAFQFVDAQKVTMEEVKQQCSNLPYEKRVRLSVSSFSISTPKASGKFGDELSQMLSNALQEVNCFNVLLSIKDSKDLTDEITFGQAGNTAAGSSPSTGKMKGAQVIVMGRVTEYAEGESSGGAMGIKIGGNKAHVGFIIQLVNAETREVISSKSINVDGSSSGFKGVRLFGLAMAGSVLNKAVADACEKGVIQAVEFISANKDRMNLPEGSSGVAASKKFGSSNCTVLSSSFVPKIMVILPEFHLTRRIPDPAGETEINRKFVEAGFHVVDPSMYATIRNGANFAEAAKNPAKAISLGKEFGADIVIYGEAFSEVGARQNSQVSCRARVEVRAVKTSDAMIVATHGLDAGALDNVESVASKAALRNAGSLAADYLLEQFCTKNITFAKQAAGTSASSSKAASATKSITEINIKNADYSKMKPLLELLATKGSVQEKSVANGHGYIKLEHETKLVLEDLIDSKLGSKFSIDEFGNGKMTLTAKQ